MTKTTIDIHNCPRAVLGWTHLPAITEYIGNADLKLDIFYQFSTGELLILDEQIINDNGVEKMRIPSQGIIATDSLSRIWIDWSLRPTQYSLTDLPKDFEGEIVIVGVSAQGLSNPVATSLGEMLPQDLQAAVLGTVIANKSRPVITRPDYSDGLEIIIMIVSGLLLVFFANWRKSDK